MAENSGPKTKKKSSIVFNLSIIVTLAIILSGALAVGIGRYRAANQYRFEIRKQMEVTARVLSVALRSKLAMGDSDIGDIVNESVGRNEDIIFCRVLDPGGKVLFDTLPPGGAEFRKDPRNLQDVAQLRVPVETGGRKYGTVVVGYEETGVLLNERRHRMLLAARTISSNISQALGDGDYERGGYLVREFVSGDPDYFYSILYSRNDIPLYRNIEGRENSEVSDELINSLGGLDIHTPDVSEENPEIMRVIHDTGKGDFIDTQILLKSAGAPVGTLRLGYSLNSLEQAERKSDIFMFLVILAFVCLGLFAAVVVSRKFAEPIISIAGAARDVAKGNMERNVEVKSGGRELQALADSFNEMVEHRRDAENKLVEGRNQLQGLARRVLSVQEEERARIARELHDEFGHRVMGLSLKLSYFKKKDYLPQEEAESFSSLIKETSDEVIRIYRGLSPAFTERMGLSEAVDSLVAGVEEQSGLCIDTDIDDMDQGAFALEITMNMYRIAQEALNNIMKHARADRVFLSLKNTGDGLRLEVCDNGRGMNFSWSNEFGGIGMLGMRERTLAMGGTIDVDSAPSRGTAIVVKIPVARRET